MSYDHFQETAKKAEENLRLARQYRDHAPIGEFGDAVMDELLAEAQLDEAQRRAIRTAQGLTPDTFTH